MKYWSDCSPEERVERWVNVERVLNDLSPHEREKHFNMRCWGYENECGTVGCAAGLCSLDPWFQEHGWRGVYVPLSEIEKRCWANSGHRNVTAALRLLIAGVVPVDMAYHVANFFGSTERGGAHMEGAIFVNDAPRSVETVIGEVRDRIAALRLEYEVSA